MENLTEQDFNILLEAMDAWVNKDFGSGIMKTLMSGLLSDGASPEVKEKIKVESKTEEEQQKAERVLRKEQAILLKAKLLKLRDGAAIEKLGDPQC